MVAAPAAVSDRRRWFDSIYPCESCERGNIMGATNWMEVVEDIACLAAICFVIFLVYRYLRG